MTSLRRYALAVACLAVAMAACTDGPREDDGATRVADDAADDPAFHPSLDHLERGTVTLVRSDGGERVDVEVVVAETREEMRRGLMEVPELADGTGMLFDFGQERHGSFWMKDTLVPLDIGFAEADGELRVVLSMDPCEADPCPSYDPAVAYRYALEVPQGWFEANDLGPGDHLEIADGG